MAKRDIELIIAELRNAELQEDGTVKVTIKYGGYGEGTMHYGSFRSFCVELIQKIAKIHDILGG